jgi:hypothetical protein
LTNASDEKLRSNRIRRKKLVAALKYNFSGVILNRRIDPLLTSS